MCSVFGTVDVNAFALPFPNNSDHTVQISQTISNVLRVPDAHGGASDGRGAKKRRKLENGGSVALQSADEFDPSQSVVLAHVALDLNLPVEQLQSLKVPDECRTSVSLIPEDFKRLDTQEFTISLKHMSTSSGFTLHATTSPEFLDQITPHLARITTLISTPSTQKGRVTFPRCILSVRGPGQRWVGLEFEIRWFLGVPVVERPPPGGRDYYRQCLNTLKTYLPVKTTETDTSLTLADFYDAVHVPSTDEYVPPRVQQSLTDTQLFPFQQRAVKWLLGREGVEISPSGEIRPVQPSTTALPLSFQSAQDATGQTCYVSHMRGMIIKDPNDAGDMTNTLRGGILAEEMGLGKTIELIALMSLHRRGVSGGDEHDHYLGTTVKRSPATLIISPPSILEQWTHELNRHAPGLKVLHYKGLSKSSILKESSAEATVEYLMQFDVVLTTYQVLSKEIHFTMPAPDRSLRKAPVYKHKKSPLVEIGWWRVCLDEAQMVENGVSQAATVARTIPRINAWAVTGTPVRKDIDDLRGLLIFLRYHLPGGGKFDNKSVFRQIFNQLAVRHNKDKIRNELQIPPQKRVVINVPFTVIEQQNYSEMVRQMCDACWFSPTGEPLRNDRDADHPEVIERMREWLIRLRQTCLHAHVGSRNKKALSVRGGPLRTLDKVLEVMIDKNNSSIMTEARELMLLQLKRGHIHAYAKNVHIRSKTALPYYESALAQAQSYVQLCRDELAQGQQKFGLSAVALDDEMLIDDHAEDVEPEDQTGQITVLRQRLRTFLEVEHACNFFIGSTYFQLKENDRLTKPDSSEFNNLEALEELWYSKAKEVRKELLKDAQDRTQHQIENIKRKTSTAIQIIPEICERPGIESAKVFKMMETITGILNAQSSQLQEWRSKIVGFLTTPLVDQDGEKENTGDEYEDSTKTQDELYVYMMALRTLIADQNTLVNGSHDLLVDHEFKEAVKMARDENPGKRGHAPELVLEIAKIRQKLQPQATHGSLKGAISLTRSLITNLQWKSGTVDNRAATESAVLENYLDRIQDITSQQAKGVLDLEKQLDVFRTTMNLRLEFYRQLQHISDTVAPWKEELDQTFDYMQDEKLEGDQKAKEKNLARLKAKQSFFATLRSEGQQQDLDRDCIICTNTIEDGVLTTCGHRYCKVCASVWWKERRTCPTCRIKLSARDFTSISLQPMITTADESEEQSQPSSPSSASTAIYSDINDTTMKQIKMIDVAGSYGTKVDMMARHLIWIRNNDPGAKTLIFSQFADFLNVLRDAFKQWKIGASSIGEKNGIHQFKNDPAIECFLLDAKSDSSGLNLVNATYVFLCEPLINPAIELQAIARVHRIGQQRATTVFMYLVSDTVEQVIYDISVARRVEHMSRNSTSTDDSESRSRAGSVKPVLQETAIESANSAELEAALPKQLLQKKGEGEVVRKEDLWTCLFGGQKKPKVDMAELERLVASHRRADAAEERATEEGAVELTLREH